MRKLMLLILASLLIAGSAWAQPFGPGGPFGATEYTEADASPSCYNTWQFKFANGVLACNTDGSITIASLGANLTDDIFLLNTTDTFTGVLTVSGTLDAAGGSMKVPAAASPTIAVAGAFAIDTTADQIQYYGGAKRTLTYKNWSCFTLESPTAADDDVIVNHPGVAITITDIFCRVQGGTSAVITLSDGTNDLEAVTCDADGQADDGSISNGTFSINERMEFDTGTVTGTVDWVNYCWTYTIDAL